MSGGRQGRPPPLVLTRLWAKTSAKGNTYMVGRLGGVKVLVMENRDKQTEDDPTHVLMVADAPDSSRQRNGGGR